MKMTMKGREGNKKESELSIYLSIYLPYHLITTKDYYIKDHVTTFTMNYLFHLQPSSLSDSVQTKNSILIGCAEASNQCRKMKHNAN